ncbi:helix-turn-helix transcriptional regulator [Rubritalea halochordaticola]
MKTAAAYLNVSRPTLYNHLDINGGPIPSKLLKRRGYERGKRLIGKADLDAFIDRLGKEGFYEAE